MVSDEDVTPVDRFARVREAFHRLVEIDLSQRVEALRMLAEVEPEVAAELRKLLEQLDETDLLAAPEKAPPSRLGPFRLLHRIGRGGMGEVYLAERVEGGFEQQVALKLVREAALSPDSARRFVRERQILARLQHPNIAHLVDGGITPDGRPWLAMEHVAGSRITEWCRSRQLGIDACVRLMIPICDAVQFAHRNLVVHRDLKPANLLVDAEGRPRLLDFGIARLVDAGADEQTQTIAAMTPAYAAPEQREGGEITTATDIYQLAVVLRELVTGARAEAMSPAARRALRGDLGRALDKASAESPTERYASVAAFADDLRDWLARLPLRSGIGSRRQRLGKVLWQWRWPLAMLAVVVLAVGSGALLAWRQAVDKAREAEVSQQTTQFLAGLFRGADPTMARGAALSAQDLLDQGTQRLQGNSRLEPLVRARLLQTVAETYIALGHYERALVPAQAALDTRREEGTGVEIAASLDQVGEILRLQAELDRAEPLLRDALERRRTSLPKDDPAIIESLAHLAALESARGRFMEADALLADAVNAARRRFGDESSETAHYLDAHAGNLDDMGRRSESLPLHRRALAIREHILGPDDPEVATTLMSLGIHLSGSGRYDEAASMLQRALDIRTRIYGAGHPLVAFARIGLAGVYADQGRLDEAEQLAQDALASVRSSLLPDHPKVSEALNMLGLIRILRRDFEGAIPLQETVLARYVATQGDGHPDTLTAKNNLAYALMHVGRVADAEVLLRDLLQRRRGDNGQAEAHAYQNLGTALAMQGKFAEAVEAQQHAVRLQTVREGESSAATAVALRELAIAQELSGDRAEAERGFRAALAIAEAANRSHAIGMFGWTVPLAAFLIGGDRCDEAAPLLDSARAAIDASGDGGDPIVRPQLDLLRAACAASVPDAPTMAKACRAAEAIPAVIADVYPTPRVVLTTRCKAPIAK